ncbi:MAG: Lrp/AsnC family transcriptional regulator, partial [Paracoccaceae bacterium]
MEIDELDRKILQLVQQDFSPSIENLTDLVGLSRNAVWRRLRALEQNCYIMKKVAL